MDARKFQDEIDILGHFIQHYCEANGHVHRHERTLSCTHRECSYDIEIKLCGRCRELMEYSAVKLGDCPHTEKPRCRQCPNPCYEKTQWKEIAKIMRFSGMYLGVTKAKKRLFALFGK